MTKQLLLTFITGLFLVFLSNAQKSTLFLDDLAFPCIESNESQNIAETQAYLIELDNSKDLSKVVSSLPVAIQQQAVALFAFSGEYDKELLKAELTEKYGNQLYTCNNKSDWPSLDSLQQKKKSVIAVFNNDLTFTSVEQIRDNNIYDKRFSKDPLDKLVVFNSNSTDNLYNECLSMWKATGKVPNLIILPSERNSTYKSALDSINSLRRFKGIFKYNNEYLNEIYWHQKPKLITPARFSLPLTDYKEILSPYKNGYIITPREIIHHTGMPDLLREFNAFESSIDDQLIMNFSFEKKIVNLSDPDWNKIINKNVEIRKDDERGKVLHFFKPNSFIDYSKENDLNFDTPFTIATWLKPDSLTDFMGIVGVGTSFSLKLNHGIPDFTTATIKDHRTDRPLELNKWHHLTVVFNPARTVEFYINGQKNPIVNASEIKPSNQSLIIGNNIWGEQFYGSIDDLKIWDRGLSEKEIKSVYLIKATSSASKFSVYYIIISTLIVLFFAVAFYTINKRRNKRKPKTKKAATLKTDTPSIQIKLFGAFQVFSVAEGDISTRFSPLLRQMLAFFILNKAENPEGINSKQISDTFWPGSPKEKAKENRGANIKKLRKLLNELGGVSIIYKNKKWILELDNRLEIDFLLYNELKTKVGIQVHIDSDIIEKLIAILKDGNILQNLEQEWLDSYKSNISDEVIELLKSILPGLDKNSNLQIETAKTIQQFDPLNEEALKYILIALALQGNHGQAQQVYDDFCKKYMHLYNEEYPHSYTEIVKK